MGVWVDNLKERMRLKETALYKTILKEAAERIVAKDPMHLDVLSMAKGVKEIGAFRPIIVIAADTFALLSIRRR